MCHLGAGLGGQDVEIKLLKVGTFICELLSRDSIEYSAVMVELDAVFGLEAVVDTTSIR